MNYARVVHRQHWPPATPRRQVQWRASIARQDSDTKPHCWQFLRRTLKARPCTKRCRAPDASCPSPKSAKGASPCCRCPLAASASAELKRSGASSRCSDRGPIQTDSTRSAPPALEYANERPTGWRNADIREPWSCKRAYPCSWVPPDASSRDGWRRKLHATARPQHPPGPKWGAVRVHANWKDCGAQLVDRPRTRGRACCQQKCPICPPEAARQRPIWSAITQEAGAFEHGMLHARTCVALPTPTTRPRAPNGARRPNGEQGKLRHERRTNIS